MDCLACKNKSCKLNAKDCNSMRDKIIPRYKEEANNQLYFNSDKLVSNGKAGKLSRLEELVDFSLANHYKNIAIAYCYCMESMAMELNNFLKSKDLNTTSYRCTINGIKETQINNKLSNSVSCNPIGQATAINKSKADFVIEMGLCLGHDVLFHQYLKKPFSVFIVKDRVFQHNPANSLLSYQDINSQFIENYLDTNKMGMKTILWLKEQIDNNTDIIIIDLRDFEFYKAGRIDGSINIPLKMLPKAYQEKLPNKDQVIVCYCNGSIQSAYAVMFLYSKGYQHVYNLSGGYSAWEKN